MLFTIQALAGSVLHPCHPRNPWSSPALAKSPAQPKDHPRSRWWGCYPDQFCSFDEVFAMKERKQHIDKLLRRCLRFPRSPGAVHSGLSHPRAIDDTVGMRPRQTCAKFPPTMKTTRDQTGSGNWIL